MRYDVDMLIDLCSSWSRDKMILANSTKLAQLAKLVSEVGELADNVAKEKDISDDIGDCIVVLNNLALMSGTTFVACLHTAYQDIKDRKGYMNSSGVFIKEERHDWL